MSFIILRINNILFYYGGAYILHFRVPICIVKTMFPTREWYPPRATGIFLFVYPIFFCQFNDKIYKIAKGWMSELGFYNIT